MYFSTISFGIIAHAHNTRWSASTIRSWLQYLSALSHMRIPLGGLRQRYDLDSDKLTYCICIYLMKYTQILTLIYVLWKASSLNLSMYVLDLTALGSLLYMYQAPNTTKRRLFDTRSFQITESDSHLAMNFWTLSLFYD